MREAALDRLLVPGRQGHRTNCVISDRPVETFAAIEDAVFGVDDAGVVVGASIGARWVRSESAF